jgi:hypothetical protein
MQSVCHGRSRSLIREEQGDCVFAYLDLTWRFVSGLGLTDASFENPTVPDKMQSELPVFPPEFREASMRIALKSTMQATLPLDKPTVSEKAIRKTPPPPAANCAAVEIHSYLAARDLLFREAEENPTEDNLSRATAANESVEICLRPARSPYQAQSLPEAEAARERRHCKAVKMRIAELRARAGMRRRAA